MPASSANATGATRARWAKASRVRTGESAEGAVSRPVLADPALGPRQPTLAPGARSIMAYAPVRPMYLVPASTPVLEATTDPILAPDALRTTKLIE